MEAFVNNLVFNTTAAQLKTSIFGVAPDTSLQAIKVDASSNMLVAVATSVTIGNASLTVAGTVTIGNSTLTTLISGSTFTSNAVTSTSGTGTGVIFGDTDISTLKNESIFIYNEGATPITISLQLSPTTTTTDYIDDAAYTDVVVAGNGNSFIAVAKFAHYIRLEYNVGASTVTFSAYYNGQA